MNSWREESDPQKGAMWKDRDEGKLLFHAALGERVRKHGVRVQILTNFGKALVLEFERSRIASRHSNANANAQRPRADFTAQFKTDFQEASKDSKSTPIPYLLEGIGGVEKFNQADGIHPTPEGQVKIAKNVRSTLRPTITE